MKSQLVFDMDNIILVYIMLYSQKHLTSIRSTVFFGKVRSVFIPIFINKCLAITFYRYLVNITFIVSYLDVRSRKRLKMDLVIFEMDIMYRPLTHEKLQKDMDNHSSWVVYVRLFFTICTLSHTNFINHNRIFQTIYRFSG